MTSIPEHVLDGLRIEDALGPEVQLVGRGGAQAFLNAYIEEIQAETLGDLTLEDRVPTLGLPLLHALPPAFLYAFLSAFTAQSFRKCHNGGLLPGFKEFRDNLATGRNRRSVSP
jgi:hypothetical protein